MGKRLCQSLFLMKLQAVCNFVKKETLAQVFSWKFCEIFKNNFFTEYLRAAITVLNNLRGNKFLRIIAKYNFF